MPDLFFIFFFFALGACVGSFLNVVVWRLPRNESIVSPPSRCPMCEHRLAWYDNLPVIGWMALRGRCRYCFNPISARYPTVEFLTGAMFVLIYAVFFLAHGGPCWIEFHTVEFIGERAAHFGLRTIAEDWSVYLLAVFLMSCLLGASMIDARHYFIPMGIPILMTVVGIVWHTMFDHPRGPMALSIPNNTIMAALATGGAIGLVISNLMLWKGIIVRSFVDGYPALEIEKEPPKEEPPGWLLLAIRRMIDFYRLPLTPEQRRTMEQYRMAGEARERQREKEFQEMLKASQPPMKEFTRGDIRREMGREIVFLLPPLIGSLAFGAAVMLVGPVGRHWRESLANYHPLSGLVGALLGALAGGFIIWIFRIFGSIVFGREAMGMGDVHLMLGIGACIGATGSVLTFFIAPFVGLIFAIYKWVFKRGHEIPYGPYLSLAAGIVLLFYCSIVAYLAPGIEGLILVMREKLW